MVEYSDGLSMPTPWIINWTSWERGLNVQLILVLLLVVIVIAWVIAKVRYYARLSERQWDRVDKSKLRQWDDDD